MASVGKGDGHNDDLFGMRLERKCWSGEDGIVTRKQLGLASGKLVGLKQAFEGMDWATVV